jgi:hypothetical protein
VATMTPTAYTATRQDRWRKCEMDIGRDGWGVEGMF